MTGPTETLAQNLEDYKG